MPVYCYATHDRSLTFEKIYEIGTAPRRLRRKGRIFYMDIAAQMGHFVPTVNNWPQVSWAAGVHPSQVEQAKQHARRNGMAIEFTPGGDAVFESRRHRSRYLKVIGMHDRDGGYGD